MSDDSEISRKRVSSKASSTVFLGSCLKSGEKRVLGRGHEMGRDVMK